ncbi:uncharacterized protein LOC143034471 isoform X2 [Oratosquilla oratoria]|uniref:uncharacterized protein LOC143034471 isoform X2 n=1 Tax=Oratosquilla oratoria TaxID=337810 RepID=UPI003F76EDFC
MPNNCSVFGCNSTKRKTAGLGIKYFKFPKEKYRRQQWIQACYRGDVFNVDNAVICSMHFTSSDYKDDLKHRLLGTEAPKSYRPLTDTAVPSLNLPQGKSVMGRCSERSARAEKRGRKRTVHEILSKAEYESRIGRGNNSDALPASAAEKSTKAKSSRETSLQDVLADPANVINESDQYEKEEGTSDKSQSHGANARRGETSEQERQPDPGHQIHLALHGNDDDADDDAPQRGLDIKTLHEVLSGVDAIIKKIKERDPNPARSGTVAYNVEQAFKVYRDILEAKKKKARQTYISSFFKSTAPPHPTPRPASADPKMPAHPVKAQLKHGAVPSQFKWSIKMLTEMSIKEKKASQQVEMATKRKIANSEGSVHTCKLPLKCSSHSGDQVIQESRGSSSSKSSRKSKSRQMHAQGESKARGRIAKGSSNGGGSNCSDKGTVADFPFAYVDIEHFAKEKLNGNDLVIKEHSVSEGFLNEEMDSMDEVVKKEKVVYGYMNDESVGESLMDEDEFLVKVEDGSFDCVVKEEVEIDERLKEESCVIPAEDCNGKEIKECYTEECTIKQEVEEGL